MLGFLVRTAVTAVGLALAAGIIPGITVTGPSTLVVAALFMGLVNGFLRPVVLIVTLPLTIVTFGLFLLVVNAGMFGLVAWMLPGFSVSGFFAALLGWAIVSIFAWVASWYIGRDGYYEVIVIDKRRH
jgi:putative membrane protein